ncbi:hypothetical protein J4558_11240 [Leptolyngbya sp. 15MV]|nr:hypothetical protein J4558_11240 [Leptolyngbya sp. 15MV]
MLQQAQRLLKAGRASEASAMLPPALADRVTGPLRASLIACWLRLDRTEEAERLGAALIADTPAQDLPRDLGEFWRTARRCLANGQPAAATIAARLAARLLDHAGRLPDLPDPVLLDALLADSQSGDGAWTLSGATWSAARR